MLTQHLIQESPIRLSVLRTESEPFPPVSRHENIRSVPAGLEQSTSQEEEMRKTQRMATRLTAALGTAALLATAVAAPAAAGQAHVNPATGKLRQPTPAEAKAVADAFRALVARSATRSMVGTQVTEHADGSVSALLGPETLNVWTVSVNADGSLSQMCVEGNAAVQQGAPALEEK
jgi:hypothetical protein